MSYETFTLSPSELASASSPPQSPIASPVMTPENPAVSELPQPAAPLRAQTGASRELVLSVLREVNAALNIDLPNVDLESIITDEFVAEANASNPENSADNSVASESDAGINNSPSGRRSRDQAPKNDVSHPVLVCGACGHIIIAVAQAVAQTVAESISENEAAGYTGTKAIAPQKKKRGGILGFKELAAKANLSPWHFHRVFRSVTDVTPKAYGEASWEHLMRRNGFEVESSASASTTGSYTKLTLSPESHISPNGSPSNGRLLMNDPSYDSGDLLDNSAKSLGPGRGAGAGRVTKARSSSYNRNRSRSRPRQTSTATQPISAMSSFQRARSLERPAIRERMGRGRSFVPEFDPLAGMNPGMTQPYYMRGPGGDFNNNNGNGNNMYMQSGNHVFNDTGVLPSSAPQWDLPGSLPSQHFMPEISTQYMDSDGSSLQMAQQRHGNYPQNTQHQSYGSGRLELGPNNGYDMDGYSTAGRSRAISSVTASAPYGPLGVPPPHALPSTRESFSTDFRLDGLDDLVSHSAAAGSESTSATSTAESPFRFDEMEELFDFGAQAKGMAPLSSLRPCDRPQHRTLSDKASEKPFGSHYRSKSHGGSFQLMPPSPTLDMPNLNGLSLQRVDEYAILDETPLQVGSLEWQITDGNDFDSYSAASQFDHGNGPLLNDEVGSLDVLGDLPPSFYMTHEQKKSYENDIVGENPNNGNYLFTEASEDPYSYDFRQEPLHA